MTEPKFTLPVFAPRVFSGIKPSGGLTLGNYLGAIKRFVGMQGPAFETIYCVVDMHAITVWQDPADLRAATREVAAGFLAAGIDPTEPLVSMLRAYQRPATSLLPRSPHPLGAVTRRPS